MPDAQPFVTPSRPGVGRGVAMAGAGGGARGLGGLRGGGVVAPPESPESPLPKLK